MPSLDERRFAPSKMHVRGLRYARIRFRRRIGQPVNDPNAHAADTAAADENSSTEATTPQAAASVCRQCGSARPADASYCGDCGYIYVDEPAAAPGSAVPDGLIGERYRLIELIAERVRRGTLPRRRHRQTRQPAASDRRAAGSSPCHCRRGPPNRRLPNPMGQYSSLTCPCQASNRRSKCPTRPIRRRGPASAGSRASCCGQRIFRCRASSTHSPRTALPT